MFGLTGWKKWAAIGGGVAGLFIAYKIFATKSHFKALTSAAPPPPAKGPAVATKRGRGHF